MRPFQKKKRANHIIFMLAVFFWSLSLEHICDADALQSNITVTSTQIKKPWFSRIMKTSNERQNMRITFNHDFVDGTTTDTYMCTAPGQRITWGLTQYTCASEDILTPQKVRVLIDTMENARTFLQETLRVDPLQGSFMLQRWRGYMDTTYSGRIISNTDFYMFVCSRPRGESSTIASAAHIQDEANSHRPLEAACFVNPRAVPNSPQNYNTADNDFFYTCIHEIFHALGISPQSYQYYHPKDSFVPYSQILCSLDKYGLRRTFLVTPHAHKLAQKHFGIDEIRGDDGSTCPSGIELENGGGQGTATAHPESRVYLSELMVGVSISDHGNFNRFTDVSMAFLLDTGNYDVDWRKGQPILWGNGNSINGRPIPGFATEPPQSVFPDQYLYNFTDFSDYCGFDYKFHGGARRARAAELSSNPGYRFYNPNNGHVIGVSNIYDYIPFRFPQKQCPANRACIPGEFLTCGDSSCDFGACFDYTLEGDTLTYKYTDNGEHKEIVCTPQDEGILKQTTQNTFDIVYKCPNIERFRRSIKMHDAYFTKDPFSDDDEEQSSFDEETPDAPGEGETSGSKNENQNNTMNGSENVDEDGNNQPKRNNKAGIIAGAVIGVIAVLVIIVVIVVIILRKPKPVDDDVENPV